MNSLTLPQTLSFGRETLAAQLSDVDIILATLTNVVESSSLELYQKYEIIIDINGSFSLIYHCLLRSKNMEKISTLVYTMLLLQLIIFYKIRFIDNDRLRSEIE